MFRVSFAACLALGVAACNSGQQTNAGQQQPPPTADNASAPDPLNALDPGDRKAFAGGGQIGGQLATLTIPQSKDEIAWMGGGSDEDFAKAAKKSFPDISKIKFNPNNDMKGDPETVAIYRDSFYSGLYFSKQIKSADGRSLFDVMTKCGRLKDPASGASVGFDTKDNNARYISIQFFPTFKRIESNETVDLNVLFERRGDKLTAGSSLFSSHVINDPTFMSDHGLRCY